LTSTLACHTLSWAAEFASKIGIHRLT
jgi:hypothetical protein